MPPYVFDVCVKYIFHMHRIFLEGNTILKVPVRFPLGREISELMQKGGLFWVI